MFAILETGGKQYKVAEGNILDIELIDEKLISKQQKITFDTVLLISHENNVHIGQPYVSNATVKAKLLAEVKDDKILIFKKKAKKQYRKTQGHRQKLHRIQIEKIDIKVPKSHKEKENE